MSDAGRQTVPIALLAICSAMGPMCVNLLLPALPQIQQFFAVPIAAAQITISAYLLAFAAGILAAGSLSDRYGRRRILIGGMLVFATGSLICAAAASLKILILGRLVQGIGAAAGITVSRAIAGDLYRDGELARRLALLTMASLLGTMISPLLGAQLAAHLGWHSCFLLLVLLGLFAAVSCYTLLPETRHVSSSGRSASRLWSESRKVIGRPVFFGYVIQIGVIYGVFMCFITVTPYVMSNALGQSGSQFGVWYLLLAGGYFLGNLFVSLGSNRISPDRQTHWGLMLQFAAAAMALAFALAGWWHPVYIFAPMLPLAYGQGLALPHLNARAVQLAPGYSGIAAALIGFSQQAVAGICVQVMGFAPTDSPVPIMLFCTVASGLALLSLYVLRSRRFAGR